MIFLTASLSNPDRTTELEEFYRKCGVLEKKTNGPFYLSDVDASYNWPERGVYFFFGQSQIERPTSVEKHRICRIGTMGNRENSSTTLWSRLRQHRGTASGNYAGGGNHRGSIFRKHVGRALIEKHDLHDKYPYWGTQISSIDDDINTETIREQEHPLEQQITEYIGNLPFLVVNCPGEPSPTADRATLEKNLIGLISQVRRTNAHIQSNNWLGQYTIHPEIFKTGLWNINYTTSIHTGDTLSLFEKYIEQTGEITNE